jgi:uncharacterized protein YndB with AHSA1/START domain
MGKMNVTVNKEARTLTIERVFDAPRELVWSAWTEPDKIVKWWAPAHWNTTSYEMDVRPGGIWKYCMEADDKSMTSCGLIKYQEVNKPELIVWKDHFTDKDGNILSNMPMMVSTIKFIEEDSKTKIMNTVQFEKVEDLEKVIAMGVEEGMGQAWDNLENFLSSIK